MKLLFLTYMLKFKKLHIKADRPLCILFQEQGYQLVIENNQKAFTSKKSP